MNSPVASFPPPPARPGASAGGVRAGEAPLRAGSVPYLNAAPLVRGLEGRLRLLPPSQLAGALERGEIDAALLSITEPLLREGYDILDGPCVASEGDVLSVFLAHRGSLAEATVIRCDTASLTSVNLLRVLLAERGLHPRFEPLGDAGSAGSHPFVLLIGDEALAFRRSQTTHAVWDLGRAWREMTGLPFVFAAWVLRREADTEGLREELLAAAERGQREFEGVIRDAPGFDEAFRREYLTRNIRSRMGPREKEGIRRFAELLARHRSGPVQSPRFVGGRGGRTAWEGAGAVVAGVDSPLARPGRAD